jgi:hypothetical protein
MVTRAVLKYGRDNFSFDVLCCGSSQYIYDLEEKAINLYNSNAAGGHGYNVAAGGKGGSKPRRGSVGKRKDDKCVYVAGFWFPNKRTAVLKLNWTTGKFRHRKMAGVLGDTHLPNFSNARNSVATIPCYYRGFWFPSMGIACHVYQTHSDTIKKDLRNRRYEQSDLMQDYKIVRKLCVFGKPYDSIEDAASSLGITRIALKGRYDRKQDTTNYSHTFLKEETPCPKP